MSVVLGVRGEGGVIVGCDDEYFDGQTRGRLVMSKVWRSEPYVIGAVGSVRTIQVLRYLTEWPEPPVDVEDFTQTLVLYVVPEIVEAARLHDVYLEGKEEKIDANIVIAWGNDLALINADLAVIVNVDGRVAAGSGGVVALGRLPYDSFLTRVDVEEALWAAHKLSDGVGSHWNIEVTRKAGR